MFAKSKNMPPMSTENQARDKLHHYLYEYLMQIGAKNSAQTFLNEIRWDKNLPPIVESPGFLFSWWNVFWDLYCAAPERRDQYESSNEAKAMHDYPMQRFQAGSRGMRIPSSMDYNANANMGPNNPMVIDQNRGAPGISPMNRLTPPGNRMAPNSQVGQMIPQSPINQQQMGFNGPTPAGPIRGMNQMAPGNTGGFQSNAPMSPMPMNMQPPQQQQQQPQQPQQQHQSRWAASNSNPPSVQPVAQPQQQNMNYSSSSPVPYGVPLSHHAPNTPITGIPSPQDGDINFNLIKNVPGNLQYHEQNLNQIQPMNPDVGHHTNINAGEILDSLKNSPITNMGGNRPNMNEEHNPSSMPEMNPYTHFPEGMF